MILFNVKFYLIDPDRDSIIESYYLHISGGSHYDLKKSTYDVVYNASGDEGYQQAIFSSLFNAIRERYSKLLDGERYHTYYIEKIIVES